MTITTERPMARRSRRREARSALLFVLPVLVLFALFRFLPIFGAGALSMTEYRLNGEAEFVGVENYARLLQDDGFWNSLRVTLGYVAIFVPLMLVVSLAGAMLLDRLTVLTGFFRALLFVPYLSSFVLAGIIWTWLLSADGPLNAAVQSTGAAPVPFLTGPQWLVLGSLALVAVWKGFGYSMLIFLAGLKAQPAEVHEAARIDGATGWQSFRHITMPLLKPVVFFLLIIETIVGFQVFDTMYTMTSGGPASASHSLIYFLYDAGFSFFDFGYAAAVGIVLFVIVLVLSLVQRRFFEERDEA